MSAASAAASPRAWFIAAVIFGLGYFALTAAEKALNPWVLYEPHRSGNALSWKPAKGKTGRILRYPTKDICHKAGHKRKAKTGKPFQCRNDG